MHRQDEDRKLQAQRDGDEPIAMLLRRGPLPWHRVRAEHAGHLLLLVLLTWDAVRWMGAASYRQASVVDVAVYDAAPATCEAQADGWLQVDVA